jgi:hypothetical protein
LPYDASSYSIIRWFSLLSLSTTRPITGPDILSPVNKKATLPGRQCSASSAMPIDTNNRHKQKMQALPVDPGINSYFIIGKSSDSRFILLSTFPTSTPCLVSGVSPIRQRSQLWSAVPDSHRIPRYRVAATNDLKKALIKSIRLSLLLML